MKNLLLTIGFFLCLGGCSTAPINAEFYLLNAPVAPAMPAAQACELGQAVVIESVELSSFLRQPGLALQTEGNKLTLSRSHLWAENLDSAVPKIMMKNLQQLSGGCQFYLKGHDWVEGEHYGIRLRIDNLQPTSSGDVITSGRFQLIDSGRRTPAAMHEFYFSRDLLNDGYPHAVTQIAALTEDIAKTVLKALEAFDQPLRASHPGN